MARLRMLRRGRKWPDKKAATVFVVGLVCCQTTRPGTIATAIMVPNGYRAGTVAEARLSTLVYCTNCYYVYYLKSFSLLQPGGKYCVWVMLSWNCCTMT